MLGLTKDQIDRSTPAQMAALFDGFDADTEVWQGDARDILIGDGSEIDAGEEYVLLGTCGELAAQYRDLAAAR